MVRGRRSGSRRSPSRTTIATVPATSGTPTSANAKKPNAPPPASRAASETITLTGDPVNARSEPAWAPNATGSSSADGGRPRRTAIRTAADSSAATAPFGVITAVSPATTSMSTAVSRAVAITGAREHPPAQPTP